MNKLHIRKTDCTPGIHFSKSDNIFELNGRSLPENASDFYEPVIDWISDYIRTPLDNTTLCFKLEYFNTSSSKCITEILDLFKNIEKINDKVFKVQWYFDKDDEDMEEMGETLKSMTQTNFEIIPIDDL